MLSQEVVKVSENSFPSRTYSFLNVRGIPDCLWVRKPLAILEIPHKLNRAKDPSHSYSLIPGTEYFCSKSVSKQFPLVKIIRRSLSTVGNALKKTNTS